jgi:hypothetical protein
MMIVAQRGGETNQRMKMKLRYIVFALAGALLAGCSGGNNSGGSSSSGTAEQSTGQGMNAQTQQNGVVQPGTTTNAPIGTNGNSGGASSPSGTDQGGSSGTSKDNTQTTPNR